jgi:hypothetical protein
MKRITMLVMSLGFCLLATAAGSKPKITVQMDDPVDVVIDGKLKPCIVMDVKPVLSIYCP